MPPGPIIESECIASFAAGRFGGIFDAPSSTDGDMFTPSHDPMFTPDDDLIFVS